MNIKDVKQIGVRIGAAPKKAATPIDANVIRELADLLTETGLTEIEVEQGGQRVRVARHGGNSVAHAAPQTVAAAQPAAQEPAVAKRETPGTLTSPMVGTVYVSPEPGKPPFVKVGDRVNEGDTLLIVEAMKTMNPILAPRGGTISEICIQDAQPVEFGQALLVIS
jgi:acetyl-CoA carboxylase biotin carboxyl carrier protein